ncbi:hypothetical protein C0993_012524 [Termitomyces sp. T159_Od127]|nr:hypothetical protein C0993_012524 [Termitomyces sp. T159_Od127]
MSRIPPNLLYLTIYNPTLKPPGNIPDDDEDAEEQAHILFYTSQERAVSRDRMLRQVGLAKALALDHGFARTKFLDPCCEFVVVSKKSRASLTEKIPQSVELAKVPRVPLQKGKGKTKDRSKANEKGKDKDLKNTPLYDYQEGSIHDLALRADILRGYEQFKLLHGSFTTILLAIGQEGLELQLERFFTVWAWSWNLEEDAEFGEHLGTPMHPSYRSLLPRIINYSQHLPDNVSSIVIQHPYVVPSPQYFSANHPTSLPRHLLSFIPITSPASEAPSHDGQITCGQSSTGGTPNGKDLPKEASSSLFLGIPTMNVNVKWGWPAALTFGKGTSKHENKQENKQELVENSTAKGKHVFDTPIPSTVAQGLDHSALADAISGDSRGLVPCVADGHSIPPLGDLEIQSESIPPPSEVPEKVIHQGTDASFVNYDQSLIDVESASITSPLNAAVPPRLPPAFSSVIVHLATSHNPHLTTRQKIYYITHDRTMLALIGLGDELATSLTDLAQNALTLLLDLGTVLSEELSRTSEQSSYVL